jgi:hypothetical protein
MLLAGSATWTRGKNHCGVESKRGRIIQFCGGTTMAHKEWLNHYVSLDKDWQSGEPTSCD